MERFLSILIVALTIVGLSHAGYQAPVAKAEERLVRSVYSKYFVPYHAPTKAMGASAPHATAKVAAAVPDTPAYWLANIKHRGRVAFNSNSTYSVFRNVKAKAYGAKGDGVTDDTAAINKAISDGNRLSPAQGGSSTTTTAVVYLPCGTYIISSPIIIYYYTQIIGNPNCMPVIQASASFSGAFLLDGDQYQPGGVLGFRPATNVFYRQIRNLKIDTTLIPAGASITAVHWPTSQATSLQNLVISMPTTPGTNHVGVLTESGSGGFVTDLVITGGLYGMTMANQQFTMRNLSFTQSNTAINLVFDWGWTYQGIVINNCNVGIDASFIDTGTPSNPKNNVNVGGLVVIDSSISNTPVGVKTSYAFGSSTPPAAGGVVLENVQLNNVPVAVQGPNSATYLAGSTSTTTIAAYAQGNTYTSGAPGHVQGTISPNTRPASLVSGSKYYTRSKPQYEKVPLSKFYSVRGAGAVGDGVTDDTVALQNAIQKCVNNSLNLFIDAGTYKVTNTIKIPKKIIIVGEGYSVIMSSGSFFNSKNSPKPVLQVGQPGDVGQVQMSDLIVSTQSGTVGQAGAVLIEWNLKSVSPTFSGMWDVHTRIGGFTGSNLGLAECPKTPTVKYTSADPKCIAAALSMHITKSASGLYMENNWLWTADHDLDSTASDAQITVYTGRGLLIDEAQGPFWLYGTAVEHHAIYQYNVYNSKNVVMGQIQTETPYYQPNPASGKPFSRGTFSNDPVFPTGKYAPKKTVPNADSFGLIVTDSSGVLFYGVGLYSFFNNYSTTCSDQGNGEVCQSRIINFSNSSISMYDLHTVGVYQMIRLNGVDIVPAADNSAGFTTELAVFRTS